MALEPAKLETQDGYSDVCVLPKFKEDDVDFEQYESAATDLKWRKEMWSVYIIGSLSPRALYATGSLDIEQWRDYDCMKTCILREYEQVPEFYRQKFRELEKGSNENNFIFSAKKARIFDKWCAVKEVVGDYDKLRNLVLIEEFKKHVNEDIQVNIECDNVDNVKNASILADDYELAHTVSFTKATQSNVLSPDNSDFKTNVPEYQGYFQKEYTRRRGPVCYRCGKTGHLQYNCRIRSVSDNHGLLLSWKKNQCEADRGYNSESNRNFHNEINLSGSERENDHIGREQNLMEHKCVDAEVEEKRIDAHIEEVRINAEVERKRIDAETEQKRFEVEMTRINTDVERARIAADVEIKRMNTELEMNRIYIQMELHRKDSECEVQAKLTCFIEQNVDNNDETTENYKNVHAKSNCREYVTAGDTNKYTEFEMNQVIRGCISDKNEDTTMYPTNGEVHTETILGNRKTDDKTEITKILKHSTEDVTNEHNTEVKLSPLTNVNSTINLDKSRHTQNNIKILQQG